MVYALIVGAYLLGSVPAAYLAAKWGRGLDIRQVGSGNVGISNLWQSTSRWLTLPIIAFDLGKGMLAVWVARLLGLGIIAEVAAGLATIAGHNWPVFLRFNGGRGILTTLGVLIILPVMNNLVPWVLLISLCIGGIGMVLHQIPLGVGFGIAALPVTSWLFGEPLPLTLGYLALFLIIVIRRLTAPETPFTGTVTRRELLVNRLLFDRDIKDRKAWIHHGLKKEKANP